MKLGIIRETKIPEDNRVAFVPEQIKKMQEKYPNVEFFVQSSPTRVYSDEEYIREGICVKDDISECDILFGIKEVAIDTLLPNKHYVFFGHIAKKQPYNRPLIQKMIQLGVTFSDYEYLVDDEGKRLCAFGWWAGVVGVYNTLRAYGLKYNLFSLEMPNCKSTLESLATQLKSVELPAVKIVVTGSGRVSTGVQFMLDKIGATSLNIDEYLQKNEVNTLTYCVAALKDLVVNKYRSNEFNRNDFKNNPQNYSSGFNRFRVSSDILISCHYWEPGQPVYLTADGLSCDDTRIKVIGDVTCDIKGSIESTLRSSTHAEPFYDYNPMTRLEEPQFSNAERNITVMAVDTLPNALALDTSKCFGDLLMEHMLPPLISSDFDNPVIKRATILEKGSLTEKFNYLSCYACVTP